MIRIFALLGYVFQSFVALALIFVVSRLLDAANYTNFSLAQAAAQWVTIFGFEWIQLAGVRFLASASGEAASRIRFSLVTAAVISSSLILALTLGVALVARISPTYLSLGAALAISQGFVDLYFMMFRVAGRLGASTTLMALRSCALFAGASLGAYAGDSAIAAILGILAGQMSGVTMAMFVDRSLLVWRPSSSTRSDIIDFCRYGMLAAGASVIHLSVPMTIRLIGLSGAVGANTAAGFSLALDLLQRPFNVLIAAIHTVAYPRIVLEFDRGSALKAKGLTAELFEFTYVATLTMLAGLLAFLPEGAHWILAPPLAASLLDVAPATALFYFLHTHLQATLAVVLHLQKSAARLCVVATVQALLVLTTLAAARLMRTDLSQLLEIGSACTLAVLLGASGPTLRFRAYPRGAVVVASSLAAAAIVASGLWTDYSLARLLLKGLLAGLCGALVLIVLLRAPSR